MPNPTRIARTVARALAIGGGGPVRTTDLLSGGLTPAQVKAAVASGALVGFQRGIWLPLEAWDVAESGVQLRLAARAALLAFPGCVISHHTAAVLHGLPLPVTTEWSRRRWFGDAGDNCNGVASGYERPTIHLTRLAGRSQASRSTTPWVHIHGGHKKIIASTVDDFPCTDLLTTAIDMGCETSSRWALAILDAAIRAQFGLDFDRRSLQAQIRQQLGRHVGRPGIRRVRRLVSFIEPASESALESISRWQMHRGRIPAPRCNVVVVGADGREYRADFLWETERVIGEADGMGKYESIADVHAEKRRQSALEQAGWRVVRWNWQQAVMQPRVMIALVRSALSLPPRF